MMEGWIAKVEEAAGRVLSAFERLCASHAYAEGVDVQEFIEIELKGDMVNAFASGE